MEQLLTPQEVAQQLKIKKATVYAMVKRGDLSAVKLDKQLRIQQQELDRFLKSRLTAEAE
jgi:putative molybdopterin biosynthesis protein